MYALAPVPTYANPSAASVRYAVCAHECVHWACIRTEGEKEVRMQCDRARDRGGEQRRDEKKREAQLRECETASRGWVSHSLSMRVGLSTRTLRRGNRLQLSEHAWPNVGVRNTTVGAFQL